MPENLEEFFSGSLSLTSETEIKSVIAGLPAHRGLVLFVDNDNMPIQLLACANIRRTTLARLGLQASQTSWKTDISKICKTLFWLERPCEFACQISYLSLCRHLFREHLKQLIHLPTLAYVSLDTLARLPYFQTSEKISFREGLFYFGPFITRKYASAYAKALNEAFGLCRNPAFLVVKKYDSCPYYQMKTCPGPCRSTDIPTEYKLAMRQALDAAAGDIDVALQEKQFQMQKLAATMEFEQAGRIRNQIECLATLKNPGYRFIHPISDFLFLHIDIQKKTKNPMLCAYLIHLAGCMELESFRLSEYDAFYQNLTVLYWPSVVFFVRDTVLLQILPVHTSSTID